MQFEIDNLAAYQILRTEQHAGLGEATGRLIHLDFLFITQKSLATVIILIGPASDKAGLPGSVQKNNQELFFASHQSSLQSLLLWSLRPVGFNYQLDRNWEPVW